MDKHFSIRVSLILLTLALFAGCGMSLSSLSVNGTGPNPNSSGEAPPLESAPNDAPPQVPLIETDNKTPEVSFPSVGECVFHSPSGNLSAVEELEIDTANSKHYVLQAGKISQLDPNGGNRKDLICEQASNFSSIAFSQSKKTLYIGTFSNGVYELNVNSLMLRRLSADHPAMRIHLSDDENSLVYIRKSWSFTGPISVGVHKISQQLPTNFEMNQVSSQGLKLTNLYEVTLLNEVAYALALTDDNEYKVVALDLAGGKISTVLSATGEIESFSAMYALSPSKDKTSLLISHGSGGDCHITKLNLSTNLGTKILSSSDGSDPSMKSVRDIWIDSNSTKIFFVNFESTSQIFKFDTESSDLNLESSL